MQEFYCPPKIVTGDGSASALGAEAKALGATRVVLVTDKVLHEKTDCVATPWPALKRRGSPPRCSTTSSPIR